MNLMIYREDFKELIDNFILEDDYFARSPREALENHGGDKNYFPILCMEGEKLLGFFLLYDGDNKEDYTDNKKSLVFKGFSIDTRHQGKGYGKDAILGLKDFAKLNFPNRESIVLGVNEKNMGARELYIKCGFRDTGRKYEGKKGWQNILELDLS